MTTTSDKADARTTLATTVDITAQGRCPNSTRSDVSFRRHRIVIDEPTARHGTDAGGMPLEILMSALVGCTNVISNRIAGEMGIALENMSIDVVGHFDIAALRGEDCAPFPEIDLAISVTTSASSEEIDELRARLAKCCPVSVVLSRSGAIIHDKWIVNRC